MALKILLSLSFGMPIVAAALAISWGIGTQEELASKEAERQPVELVSAEPQFSRIQAR